MTTDAQVAGTDLMEVQRLFEEVLTPLLMGLGIVALTVPLLLLFHRRYEMGDWIEEAKGQIARWRERVRTWLYQHPRVVHVLGVVWLLSVLWVIGMLAGAILLHHWFPMGLWGFLTLKMVAPLRQLLFLPVVPSDQEQPERLEPLLPLTAADQAAVQEIYQQRRRKR